MSTDALPPTGQRLVSVAEMRALEQAAFARGITPAGLMETAGLGVARVLRRWLGSCAAGLARRRTLADETLLYLIGSGNNGGDGLIVARALAPYARATRIYLVRDRGDDPLVTAAQAAGAIVQPGTTDTGRNRLAAWLREAGVVVDAILGIGASPPLRGPAQEVLAAVRQARRGTWPRTVAVDVPSGIDSDGGQADPVAFARRYDGLHRAGEAGSLSPPRCRPGRPDTERGFGVVGRDAGGGPRPARCSRRTRRSQRSCRLAPLPATRGRSGRRLWSVGACSIRARRDCPRALPAALAPAS